MYSCTTERCGPTDGKFESASTNRESDVQAPEAKPICSGSLGISPSSTPNHEIDEAKGKDRELGHTYPIMTLKQDGKEYVLNSEAGPKSIIM
jgi:hypothetical protein